MDSSATISDACKADAEAIQKMAELIWHRSYVGIIPVEQIDYMLDWMYDPTKIRDEMEVGTIFLWIDFLGKRSGFAAYGPDKSTAGDPPFWFLHKLYIDPDLQRRGLGSLLLTEISERAIRAEVSSIKLRVNRFNETAINAYKRNGFEIKGELCDSIGNGFVMDDYVMVKPLNIG